MARQADWLALELVAEISSLGYRTPSFSAISLLGSIRVNEVEPVGLLPRTGGNAMAMMGSLVAGYGQFRCRGWSVAMAKVGMWLAFCTERCCHTFGEP